MSSGSGLGRLSLRARRTLLEVFTGLVVTMVRHEVQYGHAPWSSGWLTFLGSWFVHYVGVIIVGGIVYVFRSQRSRIFFGVPPSGDDAQELAEARVSACYALLTVSLLVLLVKFWPEGSDYDNGYD